VADVAEVAAVTHVIVTAEPGDAGYSAESPQIPGFVMGRATYTEFAADFKQVLRDVGVTGKVQAHRQARGETPEGVEYLLRAAEGTDYPERKEALDRIERLLALDDRHDLLDREPTPTGEVLFVGVAPNDTLGDVIDQMYDAADALAMCANIAENGVLTMTILSGHAADAKGWQTLEESGWTRDTTVSEVLRTTSAGRRPPRLLVNA
jgi:hypothetical protein